jgi:hypothetical protein
VDVEGEEAAYVAHPADYQNTWFLGHFCVVWRGDRGAPRW